MLAVDIIGNVLHRSRAIKRVHRNNIANRIRLQLLQISFHPRAFKLEHPRRIAPAKQAMGRLIVQRQVIHIHIHAVICLHHFHGIVDHRQVANPQKIHLQKAQILNVVHIVLRHHLAAFGRFVNGHKFGHWLGRNHHGSRVNRRMARQTFELFPNTDHLLTRAPVFCNLTQLGHLTKCFIERHFQFCGHQF